jgi:dynein heavy chain
LTEVITKNIYQNVSRGLFEADKLIFTYLIATSVNRAENIISQMGWNLLLRGTQPISKEQADRKPQNPMPKQISDLNFELLYSAECVLETFSGMIEDIRENQEGWYNWATCLDP